MTHRREWLFPFPVSVVLTAAQTRAEYHAHRWAAWNRELVTAEATLRKDGLTFRDQPVTGGNRLDAVIDPTLSARVAECRAKAREHEMLRDEFRAIVAGLHRRATDDTVDLDADDIRWFRLGGADGDKDEDNAP